MSDDSPPPSYIAVRRGTGFFSHRDITGDAVSSITAYSFTHSSETDNEADDSFDIDITAIDTLDNTQYRVGVPPSDKERESLIDDIGVNGVEKPIIVDEEGAVIDGHYRIEICRELGITNVPTMTKEGLTELDKEAMSRRLNCQRRQLDEGAKRDLIEKALLQYDSEGIHQTDAPIATECGAEQSWANEVRGELVRDGQITTPGYLTDDLQRDRIEVAIDDDPEASNRTVARELGVSKNTVASVRESMETIRVTPDGIDVVHGDCFDADLEPESVDAVVTDPPWGSNRGELWSELAEFAERVLKDGGYCVTYVGKGPMFDHANRLNEHLEYRWLPTINLKSGSPLPNHGLWDGYRPVLLFQKPPTSWPDDFLGSDLIDGSGREKDGHEWQQSVGELTPILEWLTDPGDTVLDPFAGSGTTLVACSRNDRRAIGIEKDEEHVDTIHERLADEA